MPVDVNGNITRPPSPIPVSGQDADAPDVNVPVGDIYTAINMLAFLDGRKPLRGNTQMNGYRATGAADAVNDQDYVTLGQLQAFLGQLSQIPTGTILPYTITANSPPPGWIFASGQTLQRSTYPVLWSVVQAGTNLAPSQALKGPGQYGPGDGSTTFTVPDLNAGAYFIRGIPNGRTMGSAQDDAFGLHGHVATVNDPGHAHSTVAGTIVNAGGVNDGNLVLGFNTTTGGAQTGISVSISNSGGTETRPKNIAYPMMIKA